MSKQPRKQRTRRRDAALHERHAYLHAPLAAELRDRFGTRRTRVNQGDTVEVLRGDHAGVTGEVMDVDLRAGTINVEDVTVEKADGEEVPRPLDPSNVRITDVNLEDDRRRARLEGE